MSDNLPVADRQQLVVDAGQQLVVAKDFKVTSNAGMVESAGILQAIAALERKAGEVLDKHIANAFKTHKDLVAEKNAVMTPLAQAKLIVKKAVMAFQQDQEKIRLEVEAKAQAAADAERRKLEAKAAEAQAKAAEEAERLRKEAEAAAAAGRTSEAAKLTARADTKVAAGEQKAAQLQTRAAGVIAPIIPSSVQKVAGMSNRKTKKAVVVDKMKVLQGIVSGLIPIGAADLNEAFLNAQARLQGDDLNYPGIEVVEESGISSRSRG